MYISSPFFTAVYIVERLNNVTDNLCTKQGDSLIFGSKTRSLQSRTVSDQERVTYNGARTVSNFIKIMTRNSLPALLLAAAATNSLELLEGEEDEEDSSPFDEVYILGQ